MIKDIAVLEHQRELVESTASITGLVAGYASGKSFAATLVTLIKKLQYPEARVCYYLPTYPDIKDIAFDKFPAMCNELGLHYQLNTTKKELHIAGYGTIMFRNMSQPETIIGYDTSFSIIDECDILPKHKMDIAFKHILARNRTPVKEGNKIYVVGTPEGYRWFYSRFVENATTYTHLIKAKTTDNPFIPDDYIDNLKEAYDDRLLKQYLEGQFINVNGSAVYHQFDRKTHVVANRAIDTKLPLVLSFDFNLSPYSSIYLIQEIDGKTYVIDNAIKRNVPLVDALTYLKERFAHLGDYLYNATVYGDASGNSRSQGTGRTNYDLLREAGFSDQLVKTANPRVQDRVNLVNSRLKNGNGITRLYICERNTELISDLEQMSYDSLGRVDKSNQDLSHDTDALGYYIEYCFPINKQKELRVEYV